MARSVPPLALALSALLAAALGGAPNFESAWGDIPPAPASAPAVAQPNASAPASGADSWAEVETLARSGRYQQAIDLLKQSPARDSNYFYTLGTLAFHAQNPGLAVAYLEKAARIAPGDSDVAQNLDLAREALTRMIGASRLDPASGTIETLAESAPLPAIEGALGLIALALALLWWRRREKMARWSWIAILGLGGAIALLALFQLVANSHPPAMVLEPVPVRSGPGSHYIELARVEPGVRLRRLGPSQTGKDQQAWLQVRYSEAGDGGIGWVPAQSLLPL